jgi:hypothetical protein
MTDRYAAFTVVLRDDVRSDDAQPIIDAIRMIKGVATVDPIVSDHTLHIAQMRADQAWRDKMLELYRDGVGAEHAGRRSATSAY